MTREEVLEKVKKNAKRSVIKAIQSEDYPLEFVLEDIEYFIGKRKRPSLKEAIRGLTLMRIYARIGARTKLLRGKKTKNKYSSKKYIYTIAYMDRVLKVRGYLPDDRKRIMFFFFNFILPVISNAGLYTVLEKIRHNTHLKQQSLEKLKGSIPRKWLEMIDAYFSLIPAVKK
ncbi:MAG TPA: hypothetical protein EYG91_06710 [Aquifex aeolicus]|nr:hypothetical protein [Aquifex aeolicus]